MINANVQQEPADSYSPELAGQLAAIGIVKGKPFDAGCADEEDTHRRGRGRKRRRAHAELASPANPSEWTYYPNSSWANMLWQGGANFETPPPMITKEGFFEPLPATGARTLDSKTAFYYAYTLELPGHDHAASARRLAISDGLPGRGQECARRRQDVQGDAAERHSRGCVLVVHALRQPVALDARHAATLSARRQPELPVARRRSDADGSTTIYFGPTQPASVKRGNWIQTMPGKGWFTLLRLYSPLEPFFTKEWRLSEIELVK